MLFLWYLFFMTYVDRTVFELPENVHDLLDNNLIPADDLSGLTLSQSLATRKFFVDGYPELFVRLNEGDEIDETQLAIDAAQSLLRASRIGMVPAHVVAHDDQPYV